MPLWLGLDRVQPNRWFSPASIVESMHWRVLHRPVELAASIGQLRKWFAWAGFRELHSAEPVGLLMHIFPLNYPPSFFLSIVDVCGKGYIAVNSPRPSKI